MKKVITIVALALATISCISSKIGSHQFSGNDGRDERI